MSKSTIQELLDFSTYDTHRELAERVEVVLMLHNRRPRESAIQLYDMCGECDVRWPCLTVKALDGER